MEPTELWTLLESGADIAVIGIFFALWKIDRRIVYLETVLTQLDRRISASEILLLHNEKLKATPDIIPVSPP